MKFMKLNVVFTILIITMFINILVAEFVSAIEPIDIEPIEIIITPPPTVRINYPPDGSYYTASICPFTTCTADIYLFIEIVSSAPVSQVSVEILRNGSNYVSYNLCQPDDPIEPGDTSCPTDLDLLLADVFSLPEGAYTINVTAYGSFIPGNASVQISVYPPIGSPPGPVIINRVEPNAGSPPILVRDPDFYSDSTEVSIIGENLHTNPFLKVYFSPIGPYPDPELDSSAGLPTNEWCLYEARITGSSVINGESYLNIRIPEIPENTRWNCSSSDITATVNSFDFQTGWRLVVKDPWIRPERVHTYEAIPDPYKSLSLRETPFDLTRPKYPLLNGFGFDNEDDDASINEFLTVYGNNAYVCLGALGYCASRVLNPIYTGIWYPVYWIWIDSSGGSCNGLASTSLLMNNEILQTETFDNSVHYPVGFTNSGSPAEYDEHWYTTFFGPPTPLDLWGTIRMNHGVQTSAEYIGEMLFDMSEIYSSITGDPVARYFEIEENPDLYVVCMVDSGKGHCVTPYFANADVIGVYDNNKPKNTNSYIEINPTDNTYSFVTENGGIYSGKAIYTFPFFIWLNGRTMPSLVGELAEFLFSMVFGSADGLITTPDGSRWGWDKDGNFIDEMPGAKAIVPVGQSIPTRNIPLVLPVDKGTPNIQVNSRGGDYIFHAGQGGNILQLAVSDSVSGDTDNVTVGYEEDHLTSFSFIPERNASKLTPKIGMLMGEREVALFRWLGLSVPGGSEVKFKVLKDARGVEYENNTGIITHHYLTLNSVDGASGYYHDMIFGPFEIPAGAIHHTTLSNWPSGTSLLSEIDIDRDGNMDITELVSGVPVQLNITDTTPPFVTPPADIMVAATESGGARGNASTQLAEFLIGGSAVDTVDPSPIRLIPIIAGVEVTDNTLFPIGTTPVTFRFIDVNGNIGTATANVTVVGKPGVSGKIISKAWKSPGIMFVNLQLTNTGKGIGRNIKIKQVVPRTLSGTGTVTYNTTLSPGLPYTIGDLDVGASTTVGLYLNVPSMVTKFSITENGTVQDIVGTTLNYSTGQAVTP